ncbi:hypothetical protein GIB67_039016 [Kingdonia uniflora]|uniref:Uncharacterized protein n=1 Tax=Kingdonia uniflora TaxID=39325 RepID=A0A7J7LKV0_9MAGN|nr:hypothetical protein GIB67_039016 [Kingdonia uniflora]
MYYSQKNKPESERKRTGTPLLSEAWERLLKLLYWSCCFEYTSSNIGEFMSLGSDPFEGFEGGTVFRIEVLNDTRRTRRALRQRLIDEEIEAFEASISGRAPMEEGNDLKVLDVATDVPLAMVLPAGQKNLSWDNPRNYIDALLEASEEWVNYVFRSLGIKRKKRKMTDSLLQSFVPKDKKALKQAAPVPEVASDASRFRPRKVPTQADLGKGKVTPEALKVHQSKVLRCKRCWADFKVWVGLVFVDYWGMGFYGGELVGFAAVSVPEFSCGADLKRSFGQVSFVGVAIGLRYFIVVDVVVFLVLSVIDLEFRKSIRGAHFRRSAVWTVSPRLLFRAWFYQASFIFLNN